MKQKNLAMLGVAVGCGLVAAVAVAKLSAGGNKGPDTTKVLVAKKDLPVQTNLDEKELDNLLGWADMPKNLVPPDACTDLESVKGKSLNRTLKQGNPLSITDLGGTKTLVLPDGCKAMSVKATQVDAVAGFVKPGNRVDLLYVERLGTGKTRSAILLRKMLVLAVNMTNQVDEKSGAAIPQVESVSLAVNDRQSNLLALADEKGKLKLLLTSAGAADTTPDAKDGEIEWLDDPFESKAPPVVAVAPPKEPAPPKFDQAVVARKTVPLNTLINSDNVGEYFATVELKTAPEGVVRNPDDLKGRYIVRSIEAGQYLYKSLTGNEIVQQEKPAVLPVAPVEPVKPTAIEKKIRLPRFEQVIQEGGATRKVIWMEVAPTKWKRFETEKDAEEFKPEVADARKADEKPDASKADQ
jgi:pilus assembly protein CpaB